MAVSLLARPLLGALLIAGGLASSEFAWAQGSGPQSLSPPGQQAPSAPPRRQPRQAQPLAQQPATQQPAAQPQQNEQAAPVQQQPLQESQAQVPGAVRVANPNPSPNAIAMAKDVINLKGANQMFESVVPGVIESAKNLFLPINPQLSSQLNEVAVQLRKDNEIKKTEVMTEVARAYARRFAEPELKELLAFYKTSLGKKVLAEEPVAIEDGIKRAQEWANEFSEKMVNRFREEMKKKGHDL